MRLALLTDLHANREALEACLAHARSQRADKYAFTGDFIGYGADPAFVVDTVREYVGRGAVAVQGNHDLAVTRPSRPNMKPEAREVLDWTRDQLDTTQIAFLAELPLTRVVGEKLFVHASAHEPEKWEYVTGPDQAERSLVAAGAARMVFSGHVHMPALHRRAKDGSMGTYVPTGAGKVAVPAPHQYLVLPGSVGQPRDANNAACYAVYDDLTQEVMFHRVPYDSGAAARRVIAAGLPLVNAMRLIEGI